MSQQGWGGESHGLLPDFPRALMGPCHSRRRRHVWQSRPGVSDPAPSVGEMQMYMFCRPIRGNRPTGFPVGGQMFVGCS